MLVKAKRLGWNETLSPTQELDLDPYEHTTNELEGELEQFTIPATNEHDEIQVCLVGGQEADPTTVVPNIVDNAFLSHDDIRSRLSKAIKDQFQFNPKSGGMEESGWVAEVYDKDFVYERKGKYWRQGYSLDKKSGNITLSGNPYEVMKKTDYVTANKEGCGCGCDSCKQKNKSKVRSGITKNELSVNWIIVTNAPKKAAKKGKASGGSNCGVGPGGFQSGNKCAVGLGRGAVGKSPKGHKKGSGAAKSKLMSGSKPAMVKPSKAEMATPKKSNYSSGKLSKSDKSWKPSDSTKVPQTKPTAKKPASSVKIPGVKIGKSESSSVQDPSTGEIMQGTKYSFSASQGRGVRSQSSVTVFKAKDGTFGFKDSNNLFYQEGYSSLKEAMDDMKSTVSSHYGKKKSSPKSSFSSTEYPEEQRDPYMAKYIKSDRSRSGRSPFGPG